MRLTAVIVAMGALLFACSGKAAPARLASPTATAAQTEEQSSAPASLPGPSPTEAPAAVPSATARPAPAAAPTTAAPPPSPAAGAEARPASPERPPPTTIELTLQLAGRSFEPHQIHGNVGDTVIVTLVGESQQHTFTIDSLGVDVTVPAKATRVVQFKPTAEGITPFYCRFHGSATAGMHGQLIFH